MAQHQILTQENEQCTGVARDDYRAVQQGTLAQSNVHLTLKDKLLFVIRRLDTHRASSPGK